MTSVPGVDHPEEQTEAEVTLIGRGISVSARVEVVHDGFISVRPSVGEFVDQVVVQVGDVVEVFWKAEDAQRALPAEVTDVEQGAVIRWRMRITGPAEASQRRKAVRGRVTVPSRPSTGRSSSRARPSTSARPASAPSSRASAPPRRRAPSWTCWSRSRTASFKTKAEVVRTQARGARWVMSIRFLEHPGEGPGPGPPPRLPGAARGAGQQGRRRAARTFGGSSDARGSPGQNARCDPPAASGCPTP